MPIRHAPRVLLAAVAAAAATVAPAAAVEPSAMSCAQLWHRKNAILKAKGLCFTDPRAVRTFGNEGCKQYDPNRVSLSPPERELMAQILLAEKIKLCR